MPESNFRSQLVVSISGTSQPLKGIDKNMRRRLLVDILSGSPKDSQKH